MDLHFRKLLRWHEPIMVQQFLLVVLGNPMDRPKLNVLLCQFMNGKEKSRKTFKSIRLDAMIFRVSLPVWI